MRKFRFVGDPEGYNNLVEVGLVYNGDFDIHGDSVEYFATKVYEYDDVADDWQEVLDDSMNRPTQEQLAAVTTFDTNKSSFEEYIANAFKYTGSDALQKGWNSTQSDWSVKGGEIETPVNPQHYKNGEIECIDAIKAAVVNKPPFEAVLVGKALKYMWRYESKGGVTDVEKAIWYLGRLKKELDEKEVEYKFNYVMMVVFFVSIFALMGLTALLYHCIDKFLTWVR